jgi:hypothetical protein
MRHALIALLGLVLATTVSAKNKSKADDRGREWHFDVRWTDHAKKRQQTSFRIPSKAVQRDLDRRLKFNQGALTHRVIKAINEYAKQTKGLHLKAKKVKGKIKIVEQRGSKAKLKKAQKDIPRIIEEAKQTFYRRNGWTLLDGMIIPNHAAHAARYADDVLPVARALGSKSLSQRAFAEKAIGFVQAIPYDIRKDGRDKGFRRPLGVLARNRGDCDSKATLYLALLKAAHPDLESGFVYIKGHAYVGLGLKPQKGDMVFQADGSSWVIAEPVGPALMPVGRADKKSEKKAKKGRIEFRRSRRPEGS